MVRGEAPASVPLSSKSCKAWHRKTQIGSRGRTGRRGKTWKSLTVRVGDGRSRFILRRANRERNWSEGQKVVTCSFTPLQSEKQNCFDDCNDVQKPHLENRNSFTRVFCRKRKASCQRKLPKRSEKVVGAKGFEPSTSWSRNISAKSTSHWSGVA